MGKAEYMARARVVLNSFLTKAHRYETKELNFLASNWSAISKQFQKQIDDLSQKTNLSSNQIFNLDLYQKFLKQSQYEVEKFNRLAVSKVKDGQEYNLHLGIDATEKEIELVTTRFRRINFKAVENMIGLTSKNSSLEKLFAESYPQSVQKLNQVLVTGITQGWNPAKTAQFMKASMDYNGKRALMIARTEQNHCMRTSSIDTMKESGIVKGWIRIEAPDCCDVCQPLDGQRYDLDEYDNEEFHPNCRGATVADLGG